MRAKQFSMIYGYDKTGTKVAKKNPTTQTGDVLPSDWDRRTVYEPRVMQGLTGGPKKVRTYIVGKINIGEKDRF